MSLLIDSLNITPKKQIICILLLLFSGYSCQFSSEDNKPKTLYDKLFNSGLSATAIGIIGGFSVVSGTAFVPSMALGAGVGLATLATSHAIDTLCLDLDYPAYTKTLLAYAGCALSTQSLLNSIMPGAVAFTSALFSHVMIENYYPEANETLKQAAQTAYTASGAFFSGIAVSQALEWCAYYLKPDQ